ncbi:MAG: transrane transport protein [Ilumatobacteraceae bacterium]|nr:transrane transport protein [Ilumatobacteraceae bacterium]
MIAWSFRRLRTEMVAVAIGLAGVGMLALVTGRSMYHTYKSGGLASCLAATAADRTCETLRGQFDDKFSNLQILIIPLILLPALFGAFIGAPLVAREVEAGTHRFFWTQSITRRRWLGTTAGATLVLAVAAGGAYSLIAWAWLDVTNKVTNDRFGRMYDFQGVLPIAATVMAAAFGVLAGAVLRRTIPAMAVTLGAFIGVRLLLALAVRPHLATPVVARFPFGGGDRMAGPGAWVLSDTTVDAAGNVLGTGGSLNVSGLIGRCPSLSAATKNGFPPQSAVEACMRDLNVQSVLKYQPGNRFWTFQFLESGMLLALGAVALGLAFAAVRRRVG